VAIPRRGSRLIAVNDGVYRWRVRHKPTYCQATALRPLSFVVERAENPAGVLVVSLPAARPDNWLGAPATAIRPALVATCIRRALEQGWRPGQPGPAFTLSSPSHFSTNQLDATLEAP
jgi:hypothetical protein